MTLKQSHHLGDEVDKLSNLEHLRTLEYGAPFRVNPVTDYNPGDSINCHGLVHFYITSEGKRLFLQDIGRKEQLSYYDLGFRKEKYSEHRNAKLENIVEREREGFGLAFGATARCELDNIRIDNDDREVIWQSKVETLDTYNHFCEVKLLPLGIWYLSGAERDTPIVRWDKHSIIAEAIQIYQSYIKRNVYIKRNLDMIIDKDVHKAITKIIKRNK